MKIHHFLAALVALPALASVTPACSDHPDEGAEIITTQAVSASDHSSINVVRKKNGVFVSLDGTDANHVHHEMKLRSGVFQRDVPVDPSLHRRTYLVTQAGVLTDKNLDLTITFAYEPTSLIAFLRVVQPSTGRSAMCGLDGRASQRTQGVRLFRLFEAPGQEPISQHAYWRFDDSKRPVDCDPWSWVAPNLSDPLQYFAPVFSQYTADLPRPTLLDLSFMESNGGWSDADRQRETAWKEKAVMNGIIVGTPLLVGGLIAAAAAPDTAKPLVVFVTLVGSAAAFLAVGTASFITYEADDTLNHLHDGTTLDGGIDGTVGPVNPGPVDGGADEDGEGWKKTGGFMGGGFDPTTGTVSNSDPEDPSYGDANVGGESAESAACEGFQSAGIHVTKWCY